MTANLATRDEYNLARLEEAGAIRNEGIVSLSDKRQPGGLRFDCGYLSPFFATDPERMEVAFENVYILISEKKISSRNDLLPLLDQIAKSGKPLLIIAADVVDEALATLVVNKLRGALQVAAVRAPGIGEQRRSMLQDIATLTGGKALIDGLDLQMSDIQISDLGQAKKITIDKNNTTVEGRAEFDQTPLGPEHRSLSTAHASLLQTAGAHVKRGTQGTLSAGAVPGD